MRWFLLSIFSYNFFLNPAPTKVEKIIAKDNYIVVTFSIPMDTQINSGFEIFPKLTGNWRWNNLYELLFVSDSSILDTTVYILTIPKSLRDASGDSVGLLDLLFLPSRSISYTVYRVPFVWENVNHWDDEIDFYSGTNVYRLRPKLHPSYRKITGVSFCWEHPYRGSFKVDRAKYLYPKFISSCSKCYEASVALDGCLYLLDIYYGIRNGWYFFPENQFYRDLDVSDKGEVLIALSSNETDTETTIYLIGPNGNFVWSERYFVNRGDNFGLCFVNRLDEFLVGCSGKIRCYEILRE